MKIAVCIKQVPDTDDVKIDRKTGTLKRSEVSGILNPEDMSAVRMAAALRREMEKKGEKSSLTAITMGPPAASEVLREAMACGADEGILLCDRAFAGGDTFATSLVLAEAVKKREVSPSYLPEDRPRTVKRATWGRSWQNILELGSSPW